MLYRLLNNKIITPAHKYLNGQGFLKQKTMRQFLFYLLFSVCLINNSQARFLGGFINAKHSSGYSYKISATTFVEPGSTADVPSIKIYYNDGSYDTFWRVNNSGMGIIVENNIKKNVYEGIHTFAGVGIHLIYLSELARKAGIMNIPNSVNVDFYIETSIYVFDPSTDCISNSVDFDRMPISNTYTGNEYRSDLPLVSSDNDSISYSLIVCKSAGIDISGYYIPSDFSIDPFSGQLIWSNPGISSAGLWDFAIKVKKWRKGILVGESLFDFLLTVSPGTTSPYYFNVSPVCTINVDSNYICTINPTNTLNIKIQSSASMLKTYSETKYLSNPSAVIEDIDSVNYTWTPNTSNSRSYPYKVTFRGSQVQGIDTVYKDYVYFIYVNGTVVDTCVSPPILISTEEENAKAKSFVFYPNPASDQITIEFDLIGTKNISIEIKNVLGQTVKKVERGFLPGKNKIEIDLKEFLNGLYMVQLLTPNKTSTSKLIKQ